MNLTILSLLLFAAWTLALLSTLAVFRGSLVLFKKRKVNDFKPTGEDVSPFSQRLVRAHANCVENLPVYASVVAVSYMTNQLYVTDPLAMYALGARILQSVLHLISTKPYFVIARFTCLLAQAAILGIWIIRLIAEI